MDALLDASQHLAGHDEVRRHHHIDVEGAHPPWLESAAASEQEAAATVTEVVEHKHPVEVDRCVVALGPRRRQVLGRMEHEMAVGFELVDDEHALGVWRSVEDAVPDCEGWSSGTIESALGPLFGNKS